MTSGTLYPGQRVKFLMKSGESVARIIQRTGDKRGTSGQRKMREITMLSRGHELLWDCSPDLAYLSKSFFLKIWQVA